MFFSVVAILSQTVESYLHQHIEEEVANPDVDEPVKNVQYLCMATRFYTLWHFASLQNMHQVSARVCAVQRRICIMQQFRTTRGVLHCWSSCDTRLTQCWRGCRTNRGPSGTQHNERAHQEYMGMHGIRRRGMQEFWQEWALGQNSTFMSVLHFKICFVLCERQLKYLVAGGNSL